MSPRLAERIRGDYADQEARLLEQLNAIAGDNQALRGRVELEERLALLQIEKGLLRNLLLEGEINDETMRELNAELDERLHTIEANP